MLYWMQDIRLPQLSGRSSRQEKIPTLPYKRPMTKTGFFKKQEYVYDEVHDEYLCPGGHELSYSTTNRNGYREYKSDPQICKECPLKDKCTHSRNSQKVVTRHVWQDGVEKAEEIRHTRGVKEIYNKRKETVERVFAEGKENMGLRYTRVRGLQKNAAMAKLIFAFYNLKKLALWLGRRAQKSVRNE